MKKQKKQRVKKNNQYGSALIEVLVVLAIFSVFLAVVMRAMLSNLQATIDARMRSNGNFHAQQAMEMFIRERALLGWDEFRREVFTWSSVICLNDELPTPPDDLYDIFTDAKNTNSACGSGYDLLGATPKDGSYRRTVNVIYLKKIAGVLTPFTPIAEVDIDAVRFQIIIQWQSSKVNGPEHITTLENDFQDW